MNVSATCLSKLTHRMKFFDFMLVVASKLVYSDFERLLGVLIACIPSWGICEREFSWSEFFPLFFVTSKTSLLFLKTVLFPFFCVPPHIRAIVHINLVLLGFVCVAEVLCAGAPPRIVVVLRLPVVASFVAPIFEVLLRSDCLHGVEGLDWACLPFRQVLGKGRLF